MFLNGKLLPHPFHRRPTLFPKDLFILSFSGVIYVTPILSIVAIEHSPRSFAFGLASFPVFSGLKTHVFWFFPFFLSITPSSIFSLTIGYTSPRTYNLSLPCGVLPSYFILISFSNPNVQHVHVFFFLRKCESG